MSDRTSVLDGLVFRHCSVESLSAWTTRSVPSTNVHIWGQIPEKGLKLPVPFFSRRPSIRPQQPGWSEYCALLRRLGIPIYASVAACESLPAASTPSRFGIRYADYPLDELEVTTADAYEIVCRRGTTEGVTDAPLLDSTAITTTWPLEVQDRSQLAALASMLRDLSGGDTPIGIGLPLGISEIDIEIAIHCGFDFISLEPMDSTMIVESSQIDLVAYSVVMARSMAEKLGKIAYPLLLDFPIYTSDQFIRLLALGASAIAIDGIVSRIVAKHEPLTTPRFGKGMMSNIVEPAAEPKITFSAMEAELQAILERLRNVLTLCGCENLASLDRSRLVSIYPRTAQMTGVQLLGL